MYSQLFPKHISAKNTTLKIILNCLIFNILNTFCIFILLILIVLLNSERL